MTGFDRRSMMAGALASTFAAQASLRTPGVVDVVEFVGTGGNVGEDAFRAALAMGTTVVVPAGDYVFSEGRPVEIPSGRTLVAKGRASIRKNGAHLQPLFRAAGSHDVALVGLELVGAPRLELEMELRPGQREWPLPWPLGKPPAIAIALIAGDRSLPLQPGTDFIVHGGRIRLLPQLDTTGVAGVRMWREQALCPLVELLGATDSSLIGLTCRDGALWIRGYGNEPLRNLVRDCTLGNGQIRVWGKDNEITPIHVASMRSELPNGPRSVRIEQNRLIGRIPEGSPKHYLRFGERAAGIEIQSFASDITITGNDVRRQAGDGIWLASCSDSLIADNHVEGNGLSGIGFETAAIRQSERCALMRNTSLGNWFDGCDLNFASGPADGEITISGNTFSGNGFDMAPVSGGCGIFINGVRGAEIDANVCDDNNLAGILCVKSSAIKLSRNRCLDNGRSPRIAFGAAVGIGVEDSRGVNLVGNVCNEGGGSRQRAGIAFASVDDRRHNSMSENRRLDRLPVDVRVWDGRSYGRIEAGA